MDLPYTTIELSYAARAIAQIPTQDYVCQTVFTFRRTTAAMAFVESPGIASASRSLCATSLGHVSTLAPLPVSMVVAI